MSDDDDLPLPPEGLTYYQLLGVSEDAPEQDIQRAYRQLIKVYHPDQWDHWAADDVARRLRNGYDVLTDPRRRQRYNQDGHESFTGESTADFSDIEDWIAEINTIIDVEYPVTTDEVTEGDEGDIDIDDEFETSEETMTAEEIFDEVEDEMSDASFNEVQEEAEQEKREAHNPNYAADEPDVENIDNSDERDSVEKTYEERVKEQAAESGRARDPSAVIGERRTRDTQETETVDDAGEDKPPIQDRIRETVERPVNFIRQYLSDDVVSRAVRQAWAFRVGAVLGIYTIIIVIAESLAATGTSIAVLPTISNLTAGSGLTLLAAISFIVFAFDQMNTERDNNPGAINVAVKPSYYTALAVTANAIGLSLFGYAAYRGFDPYEAVMNIPDGMLPVGVWTDITFELGPLAGGAVLNGIIAVVMASCLALGFVFGFGAVTRYVWYYRYVNGYRVMPLWWDFALFTLSVSGLWVFLTGATSFPIPGEVGAVIVEMYPETLAVLGVSEGAVEMPGALAIAAGSPTIIGIVLTARVKAETAIRKVL